MTLWVTEDLELPVRSVALLHWRFRLDAGVVRLQIWHRTAQGEVHLDRRVEDPGARLEVSGEQLSACLEAVASRSRKKAEATHHVWTSSAVPGGLVRRESTVTRQGQPLTTVHQVEVFHREP